MNDNESRGGDGDLEPEHNLSTPSPSLPPFPSSKLLVLPITTTSSHSLPMLDTSMASAVVAQFEEVVAGLSLSHGERRALNQEVELTGEAVRDALVYVAARSKALDALETELDQKVMLLEMRELVVAAEVERHKQRLEDLSITLLQRLDKLQTLHDSLTPGFNDRFNNIVNTLKNTAKGEEEVSELIHLLDRRDGTHMPLETPFWSDCVPGKRGQGGHGGHFKAGNEVVWVNVRSGEVWVRVRQPHIDPDLNVIQDKCDDNDMSASIHHDS